MASRTAPRQPLLERWARFTHRRRGRVIAGGIATIALLIAAAVLFGGSFEKEFSLPGSESQDARTLLKERFPQRAGDAADLVFENPAGVAASQPRIEKLLAGVKAVPGVLSVESPFENPALISSDKTIARASVHWTKQGQDTPAKDLDSFIALADAANGDGLRVEAGGRPVQATEQPAFGSEALGLLAAVIILFLAFGSVAAMGLPIFAALFGIAAGAAIVQVLTNFLGFPNFTTQFMAMIGIGVGIDYSLLVVTRFREGLHSGQTVEESLVLALTTSGRAVIFAGIVVAIAFLGLLAMGLPFIAALGIGSAVVVACAVLVALTIMPAFLSLIGRRIDSWRVPFLPSTEGVDPNSGWSRLARAIQRRPLPYLLVTAAVLVLLGSPVLALRLGFTDAGNTPGSYHTRRAYDLLSKGFGPGFNGPLSVVVDVKDGGADKLPALKDALAKAPGTVPNSVVGPILNSSKDAAIFTVYATSAPQASETVDLVHWLRERVEPAILTGSAARGYVAGNTAAQIDVQDRITSRMPLLFAAVIGLSFLLLMTVFRSVLVALKAAIMNLLSIGAAYGVVVAVFQWGWGGSIIGVDKGPIEPFLPMMFFAILFGLSMDYEVFLISRIREFYMETGDNAQAVAHGLAATARVITAAAAIMVAVFLAFVLGEDRTVKEIGLGLATAIFVDATIVRLILVPATMELLGNANWWLPKWLDRLLPNINVDSPAKPAGREPVAAPSAGGGGGV